MNYKQNKILIIGGAPSVLAGLLHIIIIIGGSEWYRFFGAGEEIATMAENGSWFPGIITLGIAVVLFVWGCYAFSGAELLKRFPFLKPTLVIISGIYLLRGLSFFPVLVSNHSSGCQKAAPLNSIVIYIKTYKNKPKN